VNHTTAKKVAINIFIWFESLQSSNRAILTSYLHFILYLYIYIMLYFRIIIIHLPKYFDCAFGIILLLVSNILQRQIIKVYLHVYINQNIYITHHTNIIRMNYKYKYSGG